MNDLVGFYIYAYRIDMNNEYRETYALLKQT